MRILTIDPGHTTGIAWKDFSIDELPQTWMPVGFEDTVCLLYRLIGFENPDLIVVEKFTITAQTGKKSTGGSLEAIELIGVARFLNYYENCGDINPDKFELQSPADAKNFCPDEKLRRLGWYVPGLDHARDALRHLVLAGVRHKVLDPATLIH